MNLHFPLNQNEGILLFTHTSLIQLLLLRNSHHSWILKLTMISQHLIILIGQRFGVIILKFMRFQLNLPDILAGILHINHIFLIYLFDTLEPDLSKLTYLTLFGLGFFALVQKTIILFLIFV